MAGTTTMHVSLGIKCMNKDYYNRLLPHIIEIHNPMLQIHGGVFHKWHQDGTWKFIPG
jgi:hypothetical protein